MEQFKKDMCNSLGMNIDINKYIIKLYKESYKKSGEKHRDFPYFDFYTYLNNLDNESLYKVASIINEEDFTYLELYEIYNNIKNKKKIAESKIDSIFRDDIDNINQMDQLRPISINNGYNKYTIGEDAYPTNLSLRPESYNPNYVPNKGLSNKEIIIPNYPSSFTHSYLQENKCTKVNIINNAPLFKTKIRPKSKNILAEFCSLFMNCFPSKDDIKTKNTHQILNEVNSRINNQSLRELLGELCNLRLTLLTQEKEKLCFWLNCFNFLSLFAIFYLKFNLR